MAQNSISPGFVKLKYSVATRPHHQILPVIPAGGVYPGVNPNFEVDSGALPFTDCIDAYIPLIQPFFNTTDAQFTLAEFWSVPNPGDDPVFIYSHPIGLGGGNAATTVANSQSVFTLRSSGGGYLKLYFMETRYSVNLKDPFPYSATERAAFYGFLIDPDTNFIKARDNGQIISGMNFLTKTNDALRNKYFLNA